MAERVPCPRTLFDALVEEHMAIQQMLQEAEQRGEPSETAYERLAQAFAASASLLAEHTKEAGNG